MMTTASSDAFPHPALTKIVRPPAMAGILELKKGTPCQRARRAHHTWRRHPAQGYMQSDGEYGRLDYSVCLCCTSSYNLVTVSSTVALQDACKAVVMLQKIATQTHALKASGAPMQ